MQTKRSGKIINLIPYLLLLGVILVSKVRLIFVGLDVDEQYAVTLAYRVSVGDLPILEMWEPHQLSGLLPGLFAWLFVKVTGGVTGLFVYMRIIGVLLALVVSGAVFGVFRKDFGVNRAFLSAMLVFCVLPKWILSPEFANQQVWWSVLSVAFLYKAIKDEKIWWSIAAGLAMCLCVLAYPSSVIVFLTMVVLLSAGKKLSVLLGFAGTACGIGLAFLIWLWAKVGMDKLKTCVPYIFADPSHSESIGYRMTRLLLDALRLLGTALVYTIIAFLVVLLVTLIKSKKADIRACFKGNAFFLLWMGIAVLDQLRLIVINGKTVVLSETPYWVAFLMMVIITVRGKKEGRSLFLFAGLAGLISAMALSNLEMDASLVHLLPAVIGVILYGGTTDCEKDKVVDGAIGVGIAIVAMLMIVFVRWNEGDYPNILWPKQKVLDGPLKGIYCAYMDGYKTNECMDFLRENTDEGEKVLYLGRDSAVYLLNSYEICGASTISTPVFDERYLEYFDINPGKVPQVVIVDKEFFGEGETFSWVNSNYKLNCDNDFLEIWTK